MIYASSSDPDRVSHMAGPGDVNVGKAWRTVRRPSDMVYYFLNLLYLVKKLNCLFRMNIRNKSKNFVLKRRLERRTAKFLSKVRLPDTESKFC